MRNFIFLFIFLFPFTAGNVRARQNNAPKNRAEISMTAGGGFNDHDGQKAFWRQNNPYLGLSAAYLLDQKGTWGLRYDYRFSSERIGVVDRGFQINLISKQHLHSFSGLYHYRPSPSRAFYAGLGLAAAVTESQGSIVSPGTVLKINGQDGRPGLYLSGGWNYLFRDRLSFSFDLAYLYSKSKATRRDARTFSPATLGNTVTEEDLRNQTIFVGASIGFRFFSFHHKKAVSPLPVPSSAVKNTPPVSPPPSFPEEQNSAGNTGGQEALAFEEEKAKEEPVIQKSATPEIPSASPKVPLDMIAMKKSYQEKFKHNAPKMARRGVVRFQYFNMNARGVSIVGDFNNWDPKKNPMKRGRDMVWFAEIPIPHGTHAYIFWVDGKIAGDPSHPYGLKFRDGGWVSAVKVP